MQLSDEPITLSQFTQMLGTGVQLAVPQAIREKIAQAREIVDAAANSTAPVYGLNTGLGANLGHRVSSADINSFQRQILEGRCVATGEPLPAKTGRAVLLYRILSAAKGCSGMSPALFDHLVLCFNQGMFPPIPRYGSIGAGDLTQLAPWALTLCDMPNAPALQAKDAMALINHTGLTVALSTAALTAAQRQLRSAHIAALLSYAGYDANRTVLSHTANTLRPAPAQADTAHWLSTHLFGTSHAPRRIQEALSFRTVATTLGAAQAAFDRARQTLLDEINGSSDSPARIDTELVSTANFHTPAIALTLENLSLALSMVANAATQRIQRMMNPDLTGLPKYLSPVGGASAGMVPLQKTAAALNGEVRALAMPVAFDPAPVSDTVEDLAPMTPQVAQKLTRQIIPFRLLIAAEARTALQAIHLRNPEQLGTAITDIKSTMDPTITPITDDRPLGSDIEKTASLLEDCQSLFWTG